MWTILQGEFFWGIVAGVVLSIFGAWLLAYLTHQQAMRQQKRNVYRFAFDAVRNLRMVITELHKTRGQFNVIGNEYPEVINIEIMIYGRNREHMIHLSDDHRNRLRMFMTEVAVKRVNLLNALQEFYRLSKMADELQGQPSAGPEIAQKVRENANAWLVAAHGASEQLNGIATGAEQLEADLAKGAAR